MKKSKIIYTEFKRRKELLNDRKFLQRKRL